MEDTSPAVFIWFDSYDGRILKGPHYAEWRKILGNDKTLNTFEEILQLHLGKTLLKSLSSAREGTIIRIHKLHSCGTLCLRRLTKEEIKAFDAIVEYEEKLESTLEQLNALKTPELKELEKQVNSLRKTSRTLRDDFHKNFALSVMKD